MKIVVHTFNGHFESQHKFLIHLTSKRVKKSEALGIMTNNRIIQFFRRDILQVYTLTYFRIIITLLHYYSEILAPKGYIFIHKNLIRYIFYFNDPVNMDAS